MRFEFFHYDPLGYETFDWYKTVDMSPSMGACVRASVRVCVRTCARVCARCVQLQLRRCLFPLICAMMQ